MSEFSAGPTPELPTSNDGYHHCSNCGEVWWQTVVCLTDDGMAGAVSQDATCSGCGFPFVEVTDE